MKRFHGFVATWSIACFLMLTLQADGQARSSFDLQTATIADINRAMDSGALTSEQLVRMSLARIEAYEPKLHAINGSTGPNRPRFFSNAPSSSRAGPGR